nr:RecName: Full=Flagellin [Bartonella bacilliformis]
GAAILTNDNAMDALQDL